MPEYRNLYQWRQLRDNQRPKLLQVNQEYGLKDLSPTKRYFTPVEGKMYVNDLLTAVASLTNICFYYNQKLLEDTPKCWIGDGRFTGFGNHLYYFESTESSKYVLRKKELSNLYKLCDDIMKLKNALNDARINRENKNIQKLLTDTRELFEREPSYVRNYRWKRNRKGRNRADGGMPKRRRRFFVDVPLKF